MEGLDKLPAWIQVAVFLGVLLATTFASVMGVFKDKWFTKKVAAPSPAPGTNAVVMSAAIADSAAIAHLGSGINRLVDFLEQEREDQERRDRVLKICMQEVVDSNDRTNALLRQVLHPFGTQRVARAGERAPED